LESEASLGQHEIDGVDVEVAGLIDRSSKLVNISQMFPPNVQSFTMAHELGHAVLHSAGAGIHRDRPFSGEKISRNPTEYEADKFATYFRMPANLVKSRFAKCFCTTKFLLNEDAAFALNTSLSQAKAKCPSKRHLARLLAGTEFYNQNHFESLSSQFNVSIEAMAIRLEELDLIDF
jgi:Zn-dependent peptidase ImmA (M78 family)